ncbi:MAG: serine protease [Planctomycetota bacterium]
MKRCRLSMLALVGFVIAAILLLNNNALTHEETKGTVHVAKETMEKYKDVIVQVVLIVKTKVVYQGREIPGGLGKSEDEIEVNGTVVDPSGLTVISNFATDSSSFLNEQLAGLSGNEEDAPHIKTEQTVTSVKIVTADGKEYPAKLVLRDKDLDLAFVRPEEKGLNLPCLILAQAPEPKILDEVIAISRLDRSCNRQPSVAIGRIASIVEKPQIRYMLAAAGGDLGCPVFDASGNVLGISLMRSEINIKSLLSLRAGALLPMILPCKDIAKAMKQVPANKEEKKEETD